MKTYLITGTSRGIGLELTKQLLARGHEVIATARNPDGSKGLGEMNTKNSDSLRTEALDVTSHESVDTLVQRLKRDNICLDVIINNAGIFHEPNKRLEDTSLDLMREVFDVNAIGPVRVTRALLPLLENSDFPVVANVSSEIGSLAECHMQTGYGYCMSKAALNMFTTMLNRAHPEITCISLHPGWAKTDMGGSAAPIEPKDSGSGLADVLEKLTRDDSGKFYDFRGRQMAW